MPSDAPKRDARRDWFSYVYGCAIALMLAVLIWAAFDIHNRIPFVMMAQAPVLLLRAIWKWRKD